MSYTPQVITYSLPLCLSLYWVLLTPQVVILGASITPSHYTGCLVTPIYYLIFYSNILGVHITPTHYIGCPHHPNSLYWVFTPPQLTALTFIPNYYRVFISPLFIILGAYTTPNHCAHFHPIHYSGAHITPLHYTGCLYHPN